MECGAGYGIFLWNEGGMLLIFPNLFLVRDMLVQEVGMRELSKRLFLLVSKVVTWRCVRISLHYQPMQHVGKHAMSQ